MVVCRRWLSSVADCEARRDVNFRPVVRPVVPGAARTGLQHSVLYNMYILDLD